MKRQRFIFGFYLDTCKKLIIGEINIAQLDKIGQFTRLPVAIMKLQGYDDTSIVEVV